MPQNSYSNYDFTVLSIPSSLNLKYHYKKKSTVEKNFALAYPMLKDNNVAFFLNIFGYKEINISFAWEPTYCMKNIYKNRIHISALIQTFLNYSFGRRSLNWLNNFIKYKQHLGPLRLNDSFKSLSLSGPKFIFTHFLCPHMPFVFKKDGRLEYSYLDSAPAYIEQLYFIDKQILKFIDAVLEKSDPKPIIILQADHGSRECFFNDNIRKSFRKDDIKKLRYSMFNAYYLPDFDRSKLWDSISPVNNFRLIFNHYFGTNFQILEDKINYYGS